MFDWSKKLNSRIADIKPSGIRKFFDIVSNMPDVISLGVGEPDFVTPYFIREAAIKSIQKGYTQYLSNWGLVSLREQIARYYDLGYGVKYNPRTEIVVTVGASEAIDLSLRAIINPGDEVIMPEPCYVSYAPCVQLAGGVAVKARITEEQKFKLMPEELERVISPRTKAVILPYPNNPTGAIMTKEDLERLVPVLKKHKTVVISDEIYSELTYGHKHTSIASLPDMRAQTIVINGFSKAFAMTGWRVGYVCAPEEVLSAIVKIHQFSIMCAPSASQYAALAALVKGAEDGYQAVAEMKTEYDQRRRYMHYRLNAMGLDCFEPEGAFYCFPNISKLKIDGQEFAEKLLYSKNVAVVPGDAFGEFGKQYIRCSYANSLKNITAALDRIEEFVVQVK